MQTTARFILDRVLAPVPHRHFVLALPKMLRPYFQRHRHLLKDLCRLAQESLTEYLRTVLDVPAGMPGIILTLHTFAGNPVHPPQSLLGRKDDLGIARRPRHLSFSTQRQNQGKTGGRRLQAVAWQPMRDHTRLRAFELADPVALAIDKQTRSFPREEMFGLTSQLRRAAVSIAPNIVEGSARFSEAEYLHFLDTAYCSAREVEYQVGLAFRLGYLPERAHLELSALTVETSKVLNGQLRSLRK